MSMYGFFVRRVEKIGRCREVAVSGGSTAVSFIQNVFVLSVLNITLER